MNNASVTQWNDKSGNSRHVSQSTAANQPSYSTSRQINSVNVLDFDGTNDLLSFSTPYTSVNGISAVVIFAPDNVIGGTNIYEGRNALASWESGNLRDFSLGVRTSALSVYAENGLSSREAVGNAMWNGFGAAITYGESNATHTKAGLNGQDPALTTGSRADLRLGGFGKDPVGGTIHFDGAIAEILLYDVASISTEQRQKLEGYVAHKWNLNASLPVGHPHKITAP